jgi:HD superfamily phosphohydrolase YqeK
MSDDELAAMVDSTDDISEAERQFPVLLHGLIAVKLVREEMACTDEELLFAVRHHTCGHPEMGTLGKCLMIGDFAEETRDFPTAHTIRAELTLDIDQIALRVVESRIEYARDSNWVMDPMTVALRNTLRQQVGRKED